MRALLLHQCRVAQQSFEMLAGDVCPRCGERMEHNNNAEVGQPLTEPQRLMLDFVMDALGQCGAVLREKGWDAQLTVHTIPTLHVSLSIAINVGPIPSEVGDARVADYKSESGSSAATEVVGERQGRHPDSETLVFEREAWNRLYHEQGQRIADLEKAGEALARFVRQYVVRTHPARLTAPSPANIRRYSDARAAVSSWEEATKPW